MKRLLMATALTVCFGAAAMAQADTAVGSAPPRKATGSNHYQTSGSRSATSVTAAPGFKGGTGGGSLTPGAGRRDPSTVPGTVPPTSNATVQGSAPGGGNGGK